MLKNWGDPPKPPCSRSTQNPGADYMTNYALRKSRYPDPGQSAGTLQGP
jgi:hypothetical protein